LITTIKLNSLYYRGSFHHSVTCVG